MKTTRKFILRRLLLVPALFFLIDGWAPAEGDRDTSPSSFQYNDSNLVVITLDTLRWDHLRCYGYFRETSPNIDALAEKSLLFENAYIHLPTTLPSHTSIFTGLYPQNSGVYRNSERVDAGLTTLAEILQEHGYRTGAVASVALFYKKSGIEQGFDDFFRNWDTSVTDGAWGGWQIQGDADTANQMVFPWLKKNQKNKFFLWVHYYDIHPPYKEQEGFADAFDPDSEAFDRYLSERWDSKMSALQKSGLTNYDRQILFADHHLGRLIAFLKKLDLFTETIVVIISDHGEGLWQHDGYLSHGEHLFEEQIRVPLIIRLPGMKKQIRVPEIVQSVDLLPTLLDLLGLSPLPPTDGKSLLPLLRGKKQASAEAGYALRKLEGGDQKPLERWTSVREAGHKLILGEKGPLYFFDLDSDPHELNNLIEASNQKNTDVMKKLLEKARQKFPLPPTREQAVPKKDPDTLKILKSLGYIQ